MIDTRVGAGALLRLRHGVYVSAAVAPPDPAGMHLLRAYAELVANPSAVLSRQSAALAWGLPSPGFTPWQDFPVSVTFPSGQGHGSQSGRAEHRVAPLPPEHIMRDRSGHLITSVARTAVDLAKGLPLEQALVVLDGAARRLIAGLVVDPRRSEFSDPQLVASAREQLAEVAAQLGVGRLACAISLADPARESAAESLSAGRFWQAGLPEAECQAKVRSGFRVLFPDFLWREFGLVGECDGAGKYEDKRAAVLEKEREQELRDLDYTVVRWLALEIMLRPEVVVERVRRELIKLGWRPSASK